MESKAIVAFGIGVVVGAAAALLLAPKSGDDLRAELAREARVEREKLKDEYAKAAGEVHERLDKVQADMHATAERLKEEGNRAVGS